MTHILQIQDGTAKKHRLYDVATKLVKDMKCSVTVPLCGKLALLVRDFELDSEILSLMAHWQAAQALS